TSPTSTQAYYTDTAALTSGTFARAAPAFVLTCTKGNSIVTMNWPAYPAATGYTLKFGPGGGTTLVVSAATLSRVFNTVGQNGTFTVQATLAVGTAPVSNAKAYVIGNGVGNTDCTNA
ncbi:MAG: hypothetical protein ABIN55_14020, partial [Aeromicrobium sp.]